MAIVRTEEIKTEIQSLGLRLIFFEDEGFGLRKGGAGPAEGITVLLNGSPASVPFAPDFVASSPYAMERKGGCWTLYCHDEPLDIEVNLRSEPQFYQRCTKDGVPYKKVALLHGNDCLASTILQSCVYWEQDTGCKFCGIGLSYKSGQTILKKDPDNLAEVALQAKKEGVRHVTLTAGSTRGRQLESKLYINAAQAIRNDAGLPVHVQLMPPVSKGTLERLRDAGVVSIGIHLESFDSDVLRKIAPCKASIDLDEYYRSWEKAVQVFGKNQVSTYLLIGLGESAQSLRDGCKMAAAMGVYPFLVPFRPIPGTGLAHLKPIAAETIKEIYQETAQILDTYGLHWHDVLAGCVRCRGCSALPDYQDALILKREKIEASESISWKVIESGPLLEDSYKIRNEVFVKEQGLFNKTDRDSTESVSIHILAYKQQQCIGTVRLTPSDANGWSWLGSRLAVKQGYRGNIGIKLVKKAEEEVRKRGGRRFIAYIQLSRVKFFERCGWRCLERIPDYHGQPHMLMIASGLLWQETAPKEKYFNQAS